MLKKYLIQSVFIACGGALLGGCNEKPENTLQDTKAAVK